SSCTVSGTEALCVPSGTTTAQTYFFTDVTVKGSGTLQLRLGDASGNCSSASPLCSTALTCAPVKLYISNVMSIAGNGTAGAATPSGLSILYTGTNTTTTGCGS